MNENSYQTKQALAEYAWYICWQTSNEKERNEREDGLKVWGEILKELKIPKKQIDNFVNEKRIEQSSAYIQIIKSVSQGVHSRLTQASGE